MKTCAYCGDGAPHWTCPRHARPVYPDLGATVEKHRRKARVAGSLAEIERADIIAYGEAVGEAIRRLNKSASRRAPLPAPYRCKNDREIAAMLSRKARKEAIARCGRYSTPQPASEKYSQPGWRTDKELIAMYAAAMKEKRNARPNRRTHSDSNGESPGSNP